MVGIVIVSHSAKLAEGVRELANQMVQGSVALATAGGIDDPEHPIGTDAMAVFAAIEAVYSDDGVLILMDLGSALMSAELAIEFLTPAQQEHVMLAAAPLVEGTMAAAVQASVGGTLAQVSAEAEQALAVKLIQLGRDPHPVADPTPTAISTNAQSLTLTVRNRQGLHARPAAELVRTAAKFTAEIQIQLQSKQANAKSINQVATLGVSQGDTITVSASGSDSAAALAAIQALADANFNEADQPEAEPTPEPLEAAMPSAEGHPGTLVGIAASPGIALGPVLRYEPKLPDIVTRQIDDSAAEWARLQTAIAHAEADLVALEEESAQQVGAQEAAIFGAHALFLQDPELIDVAHDCLTDQQINAEAAWQQAIDATAETFRQLDDPYMQARAADILDVGNRVQRLLLGETMPSLTTDQPVILIAADLAPSDTARLDPAFVLGIATECGGATAHSAILARALGIPAIVGLGSAVWDAADGQQIALDGSSGQLFLTPSAETLTRLQTERDAWLASVAAQKATSSASAETRDHHQLEIVANIGSPADAPVALEFGAEGVGLFRTEFLFMGRDTVPDEAEQLAAYRRVATVFGQRPVIIRTLDVGGDKPVPALNIMPEENPFLGWRGIRFCLDRPDLFKSQLRAILRASIGEDGTRHTLKIMFPMISTVTEFRAAKAIVAEVQADLRAAAVPFDEKMEIGLMIEVPSAVAVADHLAQEADFFSIGTNDLTQYTLAADRGNAKVAGLVKALQPAVIRLIKQAVDAAHAADIWIGMCGELAGNPLATPLLVGLGLDELSMSAPAVPAVKAAIRTLTMPEAQAVAAHVLTLDSVSAVEDYLTHR